MRAVLPGLLFLAGCASQPADPTVVTSDEDRQLNEAAASLQTNSLAPESPAENAQ